MTIKGETVASGASVICPDCKQIVPGPQVMYSMAGYYIGYGGCCDPNYSRESNYFKTREEAERILSAHPLEYNRSLKYNP